MTPILACPHCGQSDDDNIELARHLREGKEIYLHCGRCGGKYHMMKCTLYEVEAMGE